MHQVGFFDLSDCYERLDKGGDKLALLIATIDWSGLQELMKTVKFKQDETREHGGKNKGGRPPMDGFMMAKIMILQENYSLSDESCEFLINDRLTFRRFLGLDLSKGSPDANTIRTWRERLEEQGIRVKIMEWFDNILLEAGYEAKGGQLIDASFVPTHKPTGKHKKQIEEGTPLTERQREQIDSDADFTKKGEQSYHGYKIHTNVDNEHKMIRDFEVTPASTHDSQCFDRLTKPVPEDASEDDKGVWADSAYRSAEAEQMLADKGLSSHVHERAYRNKPLTEEQKANNRTKSKVRVRVEHVYGQMENAMGGLMVHTVGIVRAKVKMTFKCLAYNMQRFAMLEKRKSQRSQVNCA